jgi:hypothetical protein
VRCLTAAGLLQHQVRDSDVNRRRTGRQDEPVRAADPRAGAVHLGLRIRCPASSTVFTVAGAGTFTSWFARAARSSCADAGLIEGAVREIKGLLEDAGVAHLPVGLDITELPFIFEMQRQGLTVVDAWQRMLDAREIKSIDEILLLNTPAAMVDGVYRHISEQLKPRIRENDIVALASHMLSGWGQSRSKRSTPYLANGAIRTRTTSPIASSCRAIRRSSISSTPTTATGPATTARSWSANPPQPRPTPTPGAGVDGCRN